MSYRYDAVSTLDTSSSFFGSQEISGSKDITNYLFQFGKKDRSISNVKSFSKQPDFLVYSQQLEKDIKKTNQTMKKLNEMTSKTSVFNTEDAKINELIVNVKESISGIQNKIMFLQSNNDLIYSKNSEKMAKAILEILNLRAMDIAKDFKNVLEKRTKTIKQYKEKESFYSLAGNKSSEVRSRKTEAAFLKPKRAPLDPEDMGSSGGHGEHGQASAQAQQGYDMEYLKNRKDNMRTIHKTLEEVMGVFQRISTMVQMQEVMIERIDKDTEDSMRNVSAGKGNLVKLFKNMSSMRRMIISVFIFLFIFATIYILII